MACGSDGVRREFLVKLQKAIEITLGKRFTFDFTSSKWSRKISIKDQLHDAEFYFCAVWCPQVANIPSIMTEHDLPCSRGNDLRLLHICVSTHHILMGTGLLNHPQSDYF